MNVTTITSFCLSGLPPHKVVEIVKRYGKGTANYRRARWTAV